MKTDTMMEFQGRLDFEQRKGFDLGSQACLLKNSLRNSKMGFWVRVCIYKEAYNCTLLPVVSLGSIQAELLFVSFTLFLEYDCE